MKKLFFNRHGDLVCPYCGEVPYCHPWEYWCPTCKKSFSTHDFKEQEIKENGKPRPNVFA